MIGILEEWFSIAVMVAEERGRLTEIRQHSADAFYGGSGIMTYFWYYEG